MFGVKIEVDYWRGDRRTPDGTRTQSWFHTRVRLKGVPGGHGAWSDLGVYEPTACIEIAGDRHPERSLRLRHDGSFASPLPPKSATQRRRAKERGGFARCDSSSVFFADSVEDVRAALAARTIVVGYVDSVCVAIQAVLDQLRGDDAGEAVARAAQIDAFLASLPSAA